jgi:hypothetical protein
VLCALIFIQQKDEWVSVFRITEQPDVIASGSNGMTLTVDVSFGREDIEKWISSIEKPYPLLFLDADWIERSPLIVRMLTEKKIPTGLLGHNGNTYEENKDLLKKEMAVYEKAFGIAPIWFRTADYEFPNLLKENVWDQQMNMVSASVFWNGKDAPKVENGDIVSASLHQKKRVSIEKLIVFQKEYPFQTLEETLFAFKTNTKTYP